MLQRSGVGSIKKDCRKRTCFVCGEEVEAWEDPRRKAKQQKDVEDVLSREVDVEVLSLIHI